MANPRTRQIDKIRIKRQKKEILKPLIAPKNAMFEGRQFEKNSQIEWNRQAINSEIITSFGPNRLFWKSGPAAAIALIELGKPVIITIMEGAERPTLISNVSKDINRLRVFSKCNAMVNDNVIGTKISAMRPN